MSLLIVFPDWSNLAQDQLQNWDILWSEIQGLFQETTPKPSFLLWNPRYLQLRAEFLLDYPSHDPSHSSWCPLSLLYFLPLLTNKKPPNNTH